MELTPDLIRQLVFDASQKATANRIELAGLFGVIEKTILTWRQEGMPCESAGEKGVDNVFSVPACVGWLLAREFERLTRETQRDRRDRIAADRDELAFAKDLGVLGEIGEWESEVQSMIAACRASLLGLGPKLAARLTSEMGIKIDEETITEEVEIALSKLSRLADDESESELETDDTAE